MKNLIREGKMYQLPNVIRTRRELGMKPWIRHWSIFI